MKLMVHFPVLTIILFFTSAFVFPLTGKWSKKSKYNLALISSAIPLILSLLMAFYVSNKGGFSYYVGNWVAPWGIEIKADCLSVYMASVITLLGMLVIMFTRHISPSDVEEDQIHTYYSLMLLLFGSMLGITFTWDLFNLFVFMEINSIVACAVVSIKDKRDAIEGALKYLLLSSLGSGCILIATALIYAITGNLNFSFKHRELLNIVKDYPLNILVSLSLFVVGFGVKAALVPLHVWLPDAHSSAPSPSSAVLSGLVLKVYVIGIIKVMFFVYGTAIIKELPILKLLNISASLSIILGSVIAMVQKDIKKMLAYSSIAQIGYIFLGIGLFNETSLRGALFHILSHSITKANLFLAAGNIIKKTGIREINDLKGLGSKMPVTLFAFTVSSLSMVGLPLLSGFHSKWLLGLGSLRAGQSLSLTILLVSSLLNAGYYLPIVISAFFKETSLNLREETLITKGIEKFVLITLSFMVLFFGLFPGVPMYFVTKAATLLLGN